ncbi:Fe2OG dioxygenase domain-containing protein [Psidium guajava]|nr:Fe2OG dioxygenase domain-containing protein [Psidium guajava]
MVAATSDTTAQVYDRMKAVKEFDESKAGVKGLTDSGITSIPKIFVHPPDTLSDLKPSLNAATLSIPVIDLSGLDSTDRRLSIIAQIKEAARNWGFFQLINHGVPVSAIDGTLEAIKAFHEQPQEMKSKYYRREEGRGVMYSSNNDLYRSKTATWHDALQVWMGPDPPEAEEIPEVCRGEVVAWDRHAREVAETVMELLGEGLGLERGRFKELTFSEKRLLVGICYPPCPEPERTVGLTPHSDSSFLTVLVQNRVKGLRVKHGGEWVEVSPVRGGLIVNVGDFLQIVSNGEYQSVEHCVAANSAKEPRISIVMFFHLVKWWSGSSNYYGPLPELLSPERPAMYRDFTEREFLHNIFSKGFDSKSLIEKIKIPN